MSELQPPESVPADLTHWSCEQHPWESWPHDDCAGPGVPWNTEMLRAVHLIDEAASMLNHLMRDAGVDCCGGMMECHPSCTYYRLRVYLGKEEARDERV